MSELGVIKAYYERVVAADFPRACEIGDDEPKIKAVTVRGCHGNTQNVLFFSLSVEECALRDLKYECQYCDPTMYVVAELVAELLEDRPVDAIDGIDEAEMAEALGGRARKVFREARAAIQLIHQALDEKTRNQ